MTAESESSRTRVRLQLGGPAQRGRNEARDRPRRDRERELQLGGGGAEVAEEGLERGGDLEVGALAGGARDAAAVESVARELDQGVGQPVRLGAVVVRT